MNLLISGCSFTQWPDSPGGMNVCWPKYLQDSSPEWDITNIAEAAAGNQYICDSVIREIIEKPNTYDQVLVMWSGVSRLDFLTDVTDPSWNQLFDSYGFYRRLPNDKLGWIFSGGQMGTWFKNPVAHKMFYEQYKVSSELSLAYTNIMEMIKLQNFLENKKIPYKFMSYVNYWTDNKNISPNGDFGVARYPDLNKLVAEIDFSKWIFTDEKNGLYELAKSMNDFMPDGFHPGAESHRKWAELVKSRFQ
jgi:hypothetical protein